LARNAAQALPSPTATPLTTAVLLLLLLAALMLHTHPGDVEEVVVWASTNVHNLGRHPVAAMLASTFVVTGNLLPDLAIVAVGFAVLERAVGAGRTVAIALTGQVVATLLTEYGSELGGRWQLLAESSAERPDVGVSYVMYAVLAASVMSLVGRARLLGLLMVSLSVLVSFLLAPGMTTTGHLLSVAIGAATMALLNRSTLNRSTLNRSALKRCRRARRQASPTVRSGAAARPAAGRGRDGRPPALPEGASRTLPDRPARWRPPGR
jgi:hypothetical protein